MCQPGFTKKGGARFLISELAFRKPESKFIMAIFTAPLPRMLRRRNSDPRKIFQLDWMHTGLIILLSLLIYRPGFAEVPGIDEKRAFELSQLAVGRVLPDYEFHDQNNTPLRLSDFRGKPLLVSFIYTGCFQSCPTDTLIIAKLVSAAQDVIGSNTFNIISIGFNLPFDSPDTMRAFSQQRGISAKNWRFLTPGQKQLDALTRDFGFSYLATPKGFDHITQLSVVDGNGRIYRQLYSENLNAQALLASLRDMANGEPPVEQGWAGLAVRIRLLCTVYDKQTGIYRPDYSLIVGMLVGASILGSVIYLLASEWRRQRRRQSRFD